ncbi:PDZ and PID domain containing protein [Trichuris trichiura]|uniref:PDZ and PID domain containing protein n=1 Tax=Trichuris trichiura TaxID=36087 RepID=A0A077ZH13_TRITR|nr:PDZ and PID domain containing protein [Trichuris trichiura]
MRRVESQPTLDSPLYNKCCSRRRSPSSNTDSNCSSITNSEVGGDTFAGGQNPVWILRLVGTLLSFKRFARFLVPIIHEPAVLIEGVLFRARYLGSTQIVCEGPTTKASRMLQAQEAVSCIKAPNGESQPHVEVDLFISIEKIMVLNTDMQRVSETDVRQDIMMDHNLRTISYIADIGDLLVLMARRVSQASSSDREAINSLPSRLDSFSVLTALRSQGILKRWTIRRYEPLGVVVVESGWGSMLPTVVVANMLPEGPAARCKKINIGDHVIALNGISFVGLPLHICQSHIKDVRSLTAVKITIVQTPPVVEVRIKRPDTKYQLGFSVQNGVVRSCRLAHRFSGELRCGSAARKSGYHVSHCRWRGMPFTDLASIQMKTMRTSMFRLLTGQETPHFL